MNKSDAIKPNAAMRTAVRPPPKPFYRNGRWVYETAQRPTDLMIHITGHGPRRIYRSDHTRKYYYFLNKCKIPIDVFNVLRLLQ